MAKKEMHSENVTMNHVNKFTTHTSYLGYMVTSLGYVIPLMDVWRFWFIYGAMILLYFMTIYYYIVEPLKKIVERIIIEICEKEFFHLIFYK